MWQLRHNFDQLWRWLYPTKCTICSLRWQRRFLRLKQTIWPREDLYRTDTPRRCVPTGTVPYRHVGPPLWRDFRTNSENKCSGSMASQLQRDCRVSSQHPEIYLCSESWTGIDGSKADQVYCWWSADQAGDNEQALRDLVRTYLHRPRLEFLRGVAHHLSIGTDRSTQSYCE